MCGVTFSHGKYCAQCMGYRGTRRGFVGYFDNELDAHIAYLAAKLTVLQDLTNDQTDKRIELRLLQIKDKIQSHIDTRTEFQFL